MLKNISKKISRSITGFFKNPFYKYLHIKIFWRNRYVLLLVSFIFLLNIMIWYLWVGKLLSLGFIFKTPLNINFGFMLVPRFYFLPVLGSIISFLNLFLAYIVYKKDSFSAFFIMGLTIFINISILLTVFSYILNF